MHAEPGPGRTASALRLLLAIVPALGLSYLQQAAPAMAACPPAAPRKAVVKGSVQSVKGKDRTVIRAPSKTLSLTINNYVELAIEQGLRGRQIRIEIQNAERAKAITFRQTWGPSLTANLSEAITENKTNNFVTKTDQGEAGMTMGLPLLSGGNVGLSGRYRNTWTRSATTNQMDILRPGWSANISQPIFLFIANPALRQRKRAALSLQNAQDTFRANLIALKAQARSFYYQVLTKAEALEIETKRFTSSRRLYASTLELVKAGRSPPLERMRAKVRFERDRRQLETARNALEKARRNALNFVYFPLDQDIVFTTRLVYEPFSAILEQVLQFALAHRPEVARAARARELARIDVNETSETTRPTVTLTSSFDSSETDSRIRGTPSTSIQREARAGVQLSWRFFDSFVTRLNVKQSEAARLLAEVAYEEARRSTILDATNGYEDVKSAEDQLKDYEPVIQLARSNVDTLRLQFESGKGRIIDVFDAEIEARNAAKEYLDLLVSYYETQDRLATLLGAEIEEVLP